MDILDTTLFQSTLSMRRATANRIQLRHLIVISIHALHEESDDYANNERAKTQISIHALHEESDASSVPNEASSSISIHALHEESDYVTLQSNMLFAHFNPRSP